MLTHHVVRACFALLWLQLGVRLDALGAGLGFLLAGAAVVAHANGLGHFIPPAWLAIALTSAAQVND